MSKVVSGHIWKIAIFRIFKRKTALFSDTISRNIMLCASCPQILPRFPLSLAAYPSYMPPLRTFPPLLLRIKRIYFYIFIYSFIPSARPEGLQLPAFRIRVPVLSSRRALSVPRSRRPQVLPIASGHYSLLSYFNPEGVSSRPSASCPDARTQERLEDLSAFQLPPFCFLS